MLIVIVRNAEDDRESVASPAQAALLGTAVCFACVVPSVHPRLLVPVQITVPQTCLSSITKGRLNAEVEHLQGAVCVSDAKLQRCLCAICPVVWLRVWRSLSSAGFSFMLPPCVTH
jgi:hypothetical protein